MATTDERGIFISEESDEFFPIHTYINAAMSTVSQALADLIPVGVIVPFAGKKAPSGWALCHGGGLPKDEYPELFDMVGYVYGGEGNEFGIPDMRTRVPVGYDVRNEPFNTIGNKGGAAEVTLTVAQMPSHNHSQYVTHRHSSGRTGPGVRRDHITDISHDKVTGYPKFPQGVNTGNKGGGQPHNNLQPYIVLEYIIKLK